MSYSSGPRSLSGAPGRRTRRGGVPWFFIAVLLLPVVEIAALIFVGQQLGIWWTLLLLALATVVGVWALTREGPKTWRALKKAVRSGKVPARELADAILVLVGGLLLLLPGFVTDVVGLFFLLPFTRPLTRPLLQLAIARRIIASPFGPSATAEEEFTSRSTKERRGPFGRKDVVEGEIIDDE